jgi:hypothetical protein
MPRARGPVCALWREHMIKCKALVCPAAGRCGRANRNGGELGGPAIPLLGDAHGPRARASAEAPETGRLRLDSGSSRRAL